MAFKPAIYIVYKNRENVARERKILIEILKL